jgi:hypothetical protein
MFGNIEAISSIEGQNEKIAGILTELSTIFDGGFNPNTEIRGSAETGFSIEGGGTFVSDGGVHTGLAEKLDKIYASSENTFGSSDISGAGKSASKEVKVLKSMNKGLSMANSEYVNLSNLVQQKIQNLDSLKEMLKKGFNKLYEVCSNDSTESIHKGSIKQVEDKVFEEFDRQLGILQNILKVNIKPTQKDLLDLLKKNSDFTTLAETLGVSYGDETASDRLALVFTNMSDVNILANKVKEALANLKISINEYKNIKNSEQLYNELYKVFEKFNKKNLNIDLAKMLEAMNVLKNSQGSHDDIVKALGNIKASYEDNKSSSSSSSSSSSESEEEEEEQVGQGEIEGGAYEKEIGRQRKSRLKSNLSKRITTYEKTMKELYKSFMNQVNRNFKDLSVLINLLTTKIGSEVAYDEDLRDFINMFKGFNEDIDNEKIFYSLINLDSTVAGKELKNRFNDTLDKIITASSKLNNYKVFNDITAQLKHLKETIDTMSDTVFNLKKSESEKKGSSDFMWTDKLVEQSFSMNNIKLIKDSIKKLSFYGKVSTIKENLNRMNKEQKLYQEDYDKLVGKSIGLKLTELKKEYVENVDRLNDKLRGRGRLLDEHNKKFGPSDPKHLPRGLVETIYKLQYEAKEGLYKSLEAIDLYLMHFTENLSAHPEAVMDLNQMLEQTDIIAKWFTQKSVDNLVDLLDSNVLSLKPDGTPVNDTLFPAGSLFPTLNIPPLLQNNPVIQNKIKEAFEKTKKCIDSISVLKNILSMFIHLGEKYGSINLTDKLHISPNMIYKYLIKYIWVSAFTMGYETAGGDKDSTDAIKGDMSKGPYELEKGNFESFFDVLFTTIVLPLDIYRKVEDTILPQINDMLTSSTMSPDDYNQIASLKNRLKKDIFIIDDRYFILAIKAMVGKIFTVVDTHTLLHTPDTLSNIMRNPVRMIIGAGADPEVIPEAIELYIRLPLLVEFYKFIFNDGNKKYKNNVGKDSEIEEIAYIPELGTVWSGLIQCIFDESKYIKDGIYSINNMKDIVSEVNKIYNNYKSTSKDKLVKTVVLDLIAEINRRYGILKQKDIAEFYQIKKKYIKNVVDSKFEDNVNFDILDENNEYERAGPSSQYVESTFNKYSDESLVFTDIKLVQDFRNNIYNILFGDETLTKDLSTKSFNEKIKYYKKQIQSTESKEQKFELIASAIDQSSNINAYNVDVYLLFHELVMNPIHLLEELEIKLIEFTIYFKEIKTNKVSKLFLLSELYKYFHDSNLVKVKMISNKKFIIDYSNLQTIVESSIENIKYMISKFRNLICKELIVDYENKIFKIENLLLNIIIKNDASSESYDEGSTLEYLNIENDKYFNDISITYGVDELYKHIVFGSDQTKLLANRSSQLLIDINQQYNPAGRSWAPKNMSYYDYLIPENNIQNNGSFIGKSILQKFNMLIMAYLDQFYNTSTKKIYTGLINEFGNKAMSAYIFEQGGIPDIFPTAAGLPNSPLINDPIIENSTVLSMTLVTVLRTLLTRTLNVQLPVKYHLLDNINDVSSVQIEKYKAYLPVFINYFEHLIQECIVYKKILDNPNFKPTKSIPVPASPNGIFTNPANYNLTDDFGATIQYLCKLNDGSDSFDGYKNYFHELLNNILNGSRALINDATNVLNELNYTSQFGNIRENFIKNFYNNNLQLPYLPHSLLSPIVQNGSYTSNLLPIHSINSDMNKYIYGTNYVINNLNKDKEEDVNNYLWLKEQLKIYNQGVLSTNNIDTKKVNQFLTYNNALINNSYISLHIHTNLYYSPLTTTISPSTTMTSATLFPPGTLGPAPSLGVASRSAKRDAILAERKVRFAPGVSGTNEISGGYYFLYEVSNTNELINIIENQLNENKKHSIVDKILGTTCTKDPTLREYNLDRQKAIILNVIDLNVNPINVHALMREVPLVNIYNYAFTFDNIVKSFIYNVNPDDLYTSPSTWPLPTDINEINKMRLSCLLQDPYFIDYKGGDPALSSDATTTQLFKNALELDYQPTKYESNKPNLYLSKPKYTTNLFEQLNKSAAPPASIPGATLYHNNKFLRNILFLVNLQRVIRLKVKNAVYKINTNVVSDANVLNMRITEHPVASDTSIQSDEFEITDLF